MCVCTLKNIHTYITLHCIALHYITLHYITLHYIHTYIHVCVCEITLYEFLLSQLIVASSQRLSRVISRSVQFSCSFSTQHQRILHTAPSSPQTTMAPEHSWHLSWPNCNFPRFTPASSLYSIFTEISPLRIHHFIPVQRPSRHSKPWFWSLQLPECSTGQEEDLLIFITDQLSTLLDLTFPWYLDN